MKSYKRLLANTITLLGESWHDSLLIAENIFRHEQRIAYILAPFRDLIPQSDLIEVSSIQMIKKEAPYVRLFFGLKIYYNFILH